MRQLLYVTFESPIYTRPLYGYTQEPLLTSNPFPPFVFFSKRLLLLEVSSNPPLPGVSTVSSGGHRTFFLKDERTERHNSEHNFPYYCKDLHRIPLFSFTESSQKSIPSFDPKSWLGTLIVVLLNRRTGNYSVNGLRVSVGFYLVCWAGLLRRRLTFCDSATVSVQSRRPQIFSPSPNAPLPTARSHLHLTALTCLIGAPPWQPFLSGPFVDRRQCLNPVSLWRYPFVCPPGLLSHT